jgi:hypothetical protein
VLPADIGHILNQYFDGLALASHDLAMNRFTERSLKKTVKMEISTATAGGDKP